ncbi:MAG: hypothetical protein JKY03_09770 [Aureispira sp.]|nr:hypothetical protein [Aureispira sp.]
MILQKIFYPFILMLLLISCQREVNPCSLSEDLISAIKTEDSLISQPDYQERYLEWAKEREGEPSLLNYKNEAYRFSWSHTFGGAEVYRIEKKQNGYSATIKIYVQASGTYEDSLVHSSEKWIPEAVWTEIMDGLNKNSFWTYPRIIDRRGLDGASWSLEGYNPIKNKCTYQNYHGVGRWSPIDSAFVSMCNLFMNLKEE